MKKVTSVPQVYNVSDYQSKSQTYCVHQKRDLLDAGEDVSSTLGWRFQMFIEISFPAALLGEKGLKTLKVWAQGTPGVLCGFQRVTSQRPHVHLEHQVKVGARRAGHRLGTQAASLTLPSFHGVWEPDRSGAWMHRTCRRCRWCSARV